MILSYQQLVEAINNVCQPRRNYWPVIFDAFRAFRATGCRSTELLQQNRWARVDSDRVQLTPLKGNFIRYFDASVLPTSFVDFIDGITGDYHLLTTGKLEYFMRQFWPYPGTFKGQKQSNLYLFRYYYVKTLNIEGMNLTAITEHMGWHQESIALNYINAIIETAN